MASRALASQDDVERRRSVAVLLLRFVDAGSYLYRQSLGAPLAGLARGEEWASINEALDGRWHLIVYQGSPLLRPLNRWRRANLLRPVDSSGLLGPSGRG